MHKWRSQDTLCRQFNRWTALSKTHKDALLPTIEHGLNDCLINTLSSLLPMEAIKGNPELAGAYVELADIQASNKKPQDALKTVTEGLGHAPDSKPLKRRYAELGGKLPYPEPVVKKSSPAADASPAPQQALAEAAPSSPAAVEANQPALAADKPVRAPAAPAQIEPAKIGSPKNPYGRICPD
jgi:hypothetical protein